MKKHISKVMGAFIIICTLIMPSGAFAYESTDEQLYNDGNQMAIIDENIEEDEEELQLNDESELENMSVEELNALIDSIKESVESEKQEVNTGRRNAQAKGVGKEAIKKAWLAAAEIARKSGYPCSATMVEHSVQGKNYLETGKGKLFSSRISKLQSYKKCYNGMCKNKKMKSSFEIKKSEHKDLYYALHLVNAQRFKKNGKWWMRITDRFDFDIMHYESLFTSIVNNWAWLCQQKGILNPIHAKIDFQS